jgi:hypothetical protein
MNIVPSANTTYTLQGWSNGSGLTVWGGNPAQIAPVPPTPNKEIPMVAGAAPVRTLHTRAAQVKGGYVGQVVYGDPERQTSDGTIVWESAPQQATDGYNAKSVALEVAQAALDQAFVSLFDRIPSTPAKAAPRKRAAAKSRD